MSKIGRHPFNMIDSLNVGVSAALEYWFPPNDWDRQSKISSQANKRYWAGEKEVD
jgi:hypothetical protein